MTAESIVLLAALLLILGRLAAEFRLARLNERHVLAHADRVPEHFREMIDPPTYARAVEYTLAKSRFSRVEDIYHTGILIAFLFSGILPWSHQLFVEHWGNSAWIQAAWLVAVGVALSLPSLPFEWVAQFRLEERFGFNTTTPTLWWTDRLKGLVLGLVLGWPLLVLVLKLFDWTGADWWLWTFAVLLTFQLLMLVLAPMIILPWFNKFTPLPDGPLRERLLRLAERAGFKTRGIQVMDGSKRSRHSNAFFTGFGRFRRIVLFDTLVEQLNESELEAVLAHEIGHYRRKHIPKMLAGSAAGLFLGLYALSWLVEWDTFTAAFGFPPGSLAPALLLFSLVSGTISFWLSPLLNRWSRKFEYEADAFAKRSVNGEAPLLGALRKLNTKNLSNLTPHPIYSAFYYSHPTLLERERALRGA
jgi:STE24 endopeptidase